MDNKVNKTDEEWREELSEEQYYVLRQKGTERPFTGKYYKNNDNGMYVCAGCGAELFSSTEKYNSGCGWPSFWGPANNKNIDMKMDHSHGMTRIEVLCANCGGHLGHVFDDGPAPTGQRFCINSVSIDLKTDTDEK